MLQVDENIGGRQDQKNNRLRTKTLIVGLLMVVGCFAVGYFSAGTSTYGVGCEDPSTYNPTYTPQCVNVGTGGYTCQNTRLGGATPDFQCVATRVSKQMTANSIPNDDAPQCTDDGFCPFPWQDFAHPLNYPDFNCCSKTFTVDPDCLTETKGYAVRCGGATTAIATAPPLRRKDASTLSSASSASVLRGFADSVVGEMANKAGPAIRCTEDDQCPRVTAGARGARADNCCSKRVSSDPSCETETRGTGPLWW